MVAAGCLVQWYEIEMFEEYLDSLKLSIGNLKDNVIIDMCLVTNQELETSTKDLNEILGCHFKYFLAFLKLALKIILSFGLISLLSILIYFL